MADGKIKTQFDEFFGIVNAPAEKVGKEQYEALADVRARLNTALTDGDRSAMRGEVYKIAISLKNANALPPELNPDTIRDTFDPQAFTIPTFEDQSQMSASIPGQQQSSKKYEHNEGHTPSRQPSKQTQALHSAQEEELLRQLELIQKEPNEQKRKEMVQAFFERHLDGIALINGQDSLIKEHLKTADIDLEQRKAIDAALEERTKNALTKKNTKQGFDALTKREADDLLLLDRLSREKDALRQKQILRGHIRQRQMQLYYEYGEIYSHPAFGAVLSLLLNMRHGPELESTQMEYASPSINVQPSQQDNLNQPVAYGPNKNKKNNSARGGPLRRLQKEAVEKLKKEVLEPAKKAALEALKQAANAVWDFLLANPEILAVLIAILFIIFIAAGMVLLIIATTSGAVPTSTATLPPTCSPSSDCLDKLKGFGINLSGNLEENGDPIGKAKYVYSTIALLTEPPSHFGKLLGLPDNKINLIIPANGCFGHADYSTVKVWWCGDNALSQFMMAHEMGHVLAFRNPVLFMEFYNTFVWNVSPLNTFNCLFDYGFIGGPYPGECWADMVGEYVIYKQWRDAVHIYGVLVPPGPLNYQDFPTAANGYYYKFAQKNIFNGLQY